MQGWDRKANVDVAVADPAEPFAKRFARQISVGMVEDGVVLGTAQAGDACVSVSAPVFDPRCASERLGISGIEATRGRSSAVERAVS